MSTHWLKTAAALCILCISFGVSFYKQKEFLFNFSTTEATRYVYALNPFPESLVVADYINKNTDEDDEVAILGSEPQIFFYSRRKSASKFIWMYELMEGHDYARPMQEEMVKQIESRQPKYIVLVTVGVSWLVQSFSDPFLIDWYPGYIKNNYKMTGLAVINHDKTLYKWGSKAVMSFLSSTRISPFSPFLAVYKRFSSSNESGPTAKVDGFRSARFGMSPDQVIKAILKDFRIPKTNIKITDHPTERTKNYVVDVDNLIPDSGKAKIAYIFGYRSRKLSQINILWRTPDNLQGNIKGPIDTANVLRGLFLKKGFGVDHCIPGYR